MTFLWRNHSPSASGAEMRRDERSLHLVGGMRQALDDNRFVFASAVTTARRENFGQP